MAYHHGQLGEALVDAATELARDAGPDAVVIRAVAREAGVSHNAAYRHFADRDALLRAVCERCMTKLALLMEERIAAVPDSGDPAWDAWMGLEASGRAYVEFALAEPGYFRTAFAVPREVEMFSPGEGVGETGCNPYELLGQRLDVLVSAGVIPAARRSGAEYGAWSAVHGISTLLLDGPLRELPDSERAVAIDRVMATVISGL